MIKIIQGDITTLAVDAIVNAANQMMLGGGGVDGAIHDAAGEELFKACLKVPEVRHGVRCPTGEARITPGFRLPAKFVIHTVGVHLDSYDSGVDDDEMLDGHEIVDIERVSLREGFTVMERFAESRQGRERDKLLYVLSRRHPFRGFRAEVQYLGILQEWYDFKNKAYEEFAAERLNDADVDFVDGRIVCTNPKNIQVVVAEKDDDEDEDDV